MHCWVRFVAAVGGCFELVADDAAVAGADDYGGCVGSTCEPLVAATRIGSVSVLLVAVYDFAIGKTGFVAAYRCVGGCF